MAHAPHIGDLKGRKVLEEQKQMHPETEPAEDIKELPREEKKEVKTPKSVAPKVKRKKK